MIPRKREKVRKADIGAVSVLQHFAMRANEAARKCHDDFIRTTLIIQISQALGLTGKETTELRDGLQKYTFNDLASVKDLVMSGKVIWEDGKLKLRWLS